MDFPSFLIPHDEGLAHKSFDLCLGDEVMSTTTGIEGKIVGFMYDDHECDVLIVCGRDLSRTFNASWYDDLTDFDEDTEPLHAVDYIEDLFNNKEYSFKWLESCQVKLLERKWLKFWNL